MEANWTQTCYLVFLTLEINAYTETQLLEVLDPNPWAKWAVLLLSLIGARIAMGIGTGVGGIGSVVGPYHKLSRELNENTERDRLSGTLRSQINSVAAVSPQNRGALDLLTLEKGGICISLEEECC